ncbi:sugar kinase [Novosphingobium mathurense]|uniref:2-dehydro-3-deoxygluconokinase n=1 Tax=Novosphingobium mathurense TaxID=428990 RepID=A0A1U6HTP1_9SPHN|nr:sugar kinase [Novosphingobium mathurense]SLJ99064.1 2-dehydro-3-deoxygluconokinase [Novosphingobium mathurense]
MTEVRRIVCLGECMLELSRNPGGGDGWRMGFGGDTLNTAVHLARSGHRVSYMTALGSCPFSEDLRRAWESEGIDCGLVVTHPTRRPGIYAISTNDEGERSFTYWRDSSAARAMFEISEIEEAIAKAEAADLFYFSLISMAILPPQGRRDLILLAKAVREKGGLVAFDSNYRPVLWESRYAAQYWRDQAIALANIGLPTFDDEAELCSARDEGEVAVHWQGLGCEEVIVKLGARGCLLPDGNSCPVPKTVSPVDTSGAGDAFNAGYLAARIGGGSVLDAALAGHALAGWCVMHPGAIPQFHQSAPYGRNEPNPPVAVPQ